MLTQVEANELIVAFGQHKEPYAIQDNDTGIEIDIVVEAFAKSNLTIRPLYIPFKTLESALDTFPTLDAAAGVSTSVIEYGTYIPEFSFFNNVVISKEERNITIESIADLQKHSLIAWQGASARNSPLGEAYVSTFGDEERNQDHYFELSNQYQQNAMFWSDRVELVLIDQHIFNWYKRSVGMVLDVSDPVRIHNLWNETHHTSIVFRDPELAKIFQDGLTALKESGEYEAIYNRYR